MSVGLVVWTHLPPTSKESLAPLATRGALPRTPERLLVLTGSRGNQFPRSRFAGRRVPYKSRDGAVQEPLPALDCATPCKTAAHVTGPAFCTCGAGAPLSVADCLPSAGAVLPLVTVGEFDCSLECLVNALQAVANASVSRASTSGLVEVPDVSEAHTCFAEGNRWC